MNIREEIRKTVERLFDKADTIQTKEYRKYCIDQAVDAIMKVVEKETKDIKDDNKILTAFFVEVGKSILQNPSIADIRKKLEGE